MGTTKELAERAAGRINGGLCPGMAVVVMEVPRTIEQALHFARKSPSFYEHAVVCWLAYQKGESADRCQVALGGECGHGFKPV